MTKNIIEELQKDLLRKRFNKHTKRAFLMLPELEKPKILDIGCGTGVPTMKLARLSTGHVIGLDISQPFLDELKRKVEKAGFSDRVKTVKCSMSEMDFPDESFDLIWAEGSIACNWF
ncbi:MAG: class I SAM-dependent methyltransferase [Euryarchaeota archaeon]|nr:class I SAM-dependent methyltransferase [Euryarchaeota archaeon]